MIITELRAFVGKVVELFSPASANMPAVSAAAKSCARRWRITRFRDGEDRSALADSSSESGCGSWGRGRDGCQWDRLRTLGRECWSPKTSPPRAKDERLQRSTGMAHRRTALIDVAESRRAPSTRRTPTLGLQDFFTRIRVQSMQSSPRSSHARGGARAKARKGCRNPEYDSSGGEVKILTA